MGSALISALLSEGIVGPEDLKVSDRNPERLKWLREKNVFVSPHPEDVITDTDCLFLATKPQDVSQILESVKGNFPEGMLMVSIAAGITVQHLQDAGRISKVIRVMPNTPALVRSGVSGMFSSPEVSGEEREYVLKFLKTVGEVIECYHEDQIDAITSLSGSGPAYFFRILEIMAEKAVRYGFSKENARKIVLNTMFGAGVLAKESGQDCAELRDMVTSKGGTTEAALNTFAEMQLEKILNAGIDAAYDRAKELGK